MKLFLLNLGCSKNQSDSEDLAGFLEAAGYEIVDEVSKAGIAIINTCGFIRPAVEESVESILELEELKNQGSLDTIGVIGCLVNRYGDDLKREFPSVDFWAEAQEWEKVFSELGRKIVPAKKGAISVTTWWSRYLKISEGCNCNCSFCTIPSIRGALKSIPLKLVIKQAQDLVESGARELCIVSQDPTMYGMDSAGRPIFKELLQELGSSVPNDIWIRLNYLNPSRVDIDLLEIMSETPNILPYLDSPVQHVNVDIIRAMNREGSKKKFNELFARARGIDPYFALRTTFIVGFPGETDSQFEEILDFLEENRIDRVGAFPFYPEEGTPAAGMVPVIDDKIKESRYNRLMEVQAEISLQRQRFFEGKTMDILVEDVNSEKDIVWGRSYRDAPEVDGMVGIQDLPQGCLLKEGQFITVKITEATEHDLFAEVIDDEYEKN